ncbi:hypothetical protein ACJ5NV_00330 [Loktanella agnita]|uniref:hypothetical protein n=1 Tax=Loktanella agnita TaxID=287097 RepID=UPI003985C9DC
MRAALVFLPILALTACATPREQCISGATRDVRILRMLITEVEGNIARGYALAEEQEIRTRPRMCRDEEADGSVDRYICNAVDTVTVTRPQAIDLQAEQAKLDSLRERLATAEPAANQTVAQCIATHPE